MKIYVSLLIQACNLESFDNVLVQSCRLNQHWGYIRNCTHRPSPSITFYHQVSWRSNESSALIIVPARSLLLIYFPAFEKKEDCYISLSHKSIRGNTRLTAGLKSFRRGSQWFCFFPEPETGEPDVRFWVLMTWYAGERCFKRLQWGLIGEQLFYPSKTYPKIILDRHFPSC
jgi:hypothetical protein